MPSSIATIAEAQSEVAVQPTWILACGGAGQRQADRKGGKDLFHDALPIFTTFSPGHIFLTCLSIFFLIIYFIGKQGVVQ
jgi:hypothetical protein